LSIYIPPLSARTAFHLLYGIIAVDFASIEEPKFHQTSKVFSRTDAKRSCGGSYKIVSQLFRHFPTKRVGESSSEHIPLFADMASAAARFVVPIRQALSSQRAPMTRQYMQRPQVCQWRGKARRTFSIKAACGYFSTCCTVIAGGLLTFITQWR
jgi:hypothetical protein